MGASSWTMQTRSYVPKYRMAKHEVAVNRAVYSHGCKCPPFVAEGVAGKPDLFLPGRKLYFRYSSQGVDSMTLYGYARVSVREPEDKNLDLQVELLVSAGCAMGNICADNAATLGRFNDVNI